MRYYLQKNLRRLIMSGLTLKRTLGLDDVIIFKCLRVIFSLKRELSNLRFRSIFIFNEKESRTCQFAAYRQNALFEVLTSQTGQMAFPIFKVMMR